MIVKNPLGLTRLVYKDTTNILISQIFFFIHQFGFGLYPFQSAFTPITPKELVSIRHQTEPLLLWFHSTHRCWTLVAGAGIEPA